MNPYILSQMPFFSVDSPLLDYSRNVTSQNGEDGILEFIFTKIPTSKTKYCVEFGAWDGVFLSNCHNLITQHQWNGLLIESNEQKFLQLVLNHGQNRSVTCLNLQVGFDGINCLDNILVRTNVPHDFELLSIDIDGADYFIWDSLTHFTPKVVVIEFNPSVPNDVLFVQEKSMRINHGASLLALVLLAKRMGYELVCCTSCNAIFVRAEYYSLFGIQSNHPTKLFKPTCDGRIFHGYDSSIFVCGMSTLIWSGVTVDSSDFQVLPKSLRNYSDSQA